MGDSENFRNKIQETVGELVSTYSLTLSDKDAWSRDLGWKKDEVDLGFKPTYFYVNVYVNLPPEAGTPFDFETLAMKNLPRLCGDSEAVYRYPGLGQTGRAALGSDLVFGFQHDHLPPRIGVFGGRWYHAAEHWTRVVFGTAFGREKMWLCRSCVSAPKDKKCVDMDVNALMPPVPWMAPTETRHEANDWKDEDGRLRTEESVRVERHSPSGVSFRWAAQRQGGRSGGEQRRHDAEAPGRQRSLSMIPSSRGVEVLLSSRWSPPLPRAEPEEDR